MTNILHAIFNFSNNINYSIQKHYKSRNRIHNNGDILEYYIKDLFCNSMGLDINDKELAYTDCFSYLGNTNNPPDFIVKNGDAIEVKKIEGNTNTIALNSSFPKNRLLSSDLLITEAYKNCENSQWTSKTLFYVIGNLNSNNQELNSLWFVQGECYAADAAIYERIKNTISDGINTIRGVQFAETKELGRVNKIDPLGITYLRIRGMWGIAHPNKVFSYINGIENNILNCLLTQEKYSSFSNSDRENLERNPLINIAYTNIKHPNNPAQLTPVIHIFISKDVYNG
ncbi:MAG: NgoPII family restriction endonuclease [Brevinema sp.]